MNFTFNERIEALKPSASVQQTEKAKRMIAEGVRVVNLAAGEPDFDTPAIITQKAIEQLCLGKTHYTLGLGIAPLRERIARHLNEEFHIACGKENILVTPGAKCGIYLAVQALINEGDEVMYLAPGWVTYAPIACTAGATPVAVDLPYETNYTVTRELLERHVSPKTRIPYFENRSIQVIQPDIANCGGLTEVKKICDMAHAYDIVAQIHTCGSPLQTSIAMQLEAAIPNFCIHEHHKRVRTKWMEGLTKHNPHPVDGYLAVPDEPGIGNEIMPLAYERADEIKTIQ